MTSCARMAIIGSFCLCTLLCAMTRGQELRAVISRADLDWDKPASRSDEGMPIGNGRMGSLVWTSPSAIKFQINRCDVFAADCTTTSFPRTHTDYASGCGFVDIDFPDFGADVLAGSNFRQHLSVYDGVCTVKGKGVTARVIAWHEKDVFAVEIDDQRDQPQPVAIDLRMLRYVSEMIRGQQFPATNPHSNTVPRGAHRATSAMEIRDGKIVLTQEFRERDFYNASAVVIGVVGRESRASIANETTVRLLAAPGKGKFTVLIGSASSFDRDADCAAKAQASVEAAAGIGFDRMLDQNRRWWQDFWSRGHVSLHSPDGQADFVEQNYHYFLYVMNCCSRGDYPPRFGGLLFYSNGDLRAWGTQYWWANQSCYFQGIAPANRFELLDPTFNMYTKMYDSCAVAAKQQWGTKGVWLPETSWFNGLANPDDIAAEMQDLYLLRKPWDERSEKFQRYAEAMQSFNSRWNWISQEGRWELNRWQLQDKGAPPFGHVTHIFGTTAKISYLYWQRYEYTLDEKWLRERAYPMLKGTVEFYRNFPNLKKDADGKYHLYHTNSNEPAWGVKDSDEDHAAMRGTIGPLIRASEILNVDADMRPIWREFLDTLAPLPTSDHPDALKPADYSGPRVWVKGLKPAAKPGGLLPDGNTLPHWNFDLCTVNTTDPAMLEVAHATLNAFLSRRGLGPQSRAGTLSRIPIAAAQLGRADAVKYLVPAQMRYADGGNDDDTRVFRNRMSQREGAGCTECERLGRASEALHMALLQTAPPAPGGNPVIRVFPAWPKEWDASFKLLARGAFLVSASIKSGTIGSVQIESQAGADCTLVNPWPGARVTVRTDDGQSQTLEGQQIKFTTSKGKIYHVTAHPS